MKFNRFVAAPLLLLLGGTLAACSQEPAAPGAGQDGPSAAAPSSADTTGSVIDPSEIALTYAIIDGPDYDPAADSVSYRVSVKNSGSAVLASSGVNPVNMGVVILDLAGSLKTPPANQDFMRIPLPHPLPPGEEITLDLTFPVAPTLGGMVVLDGVQENVSWFGSYGKPTLALGQFTRCNGDGNSLCTVDGVSIGTSD